MSQQPVRHLIRLSLLCIALTQQCMAQGPAPKAPPKAPNWLNQLFQRRVVPIQAGAKPVDQPAEKPGNGDTKARDAVDVRAPYDRNVANLLDRARKRVGNKDWDTAFDAIRAALNQPPALVRDSNGKYQATSVVANQILGSLPPEALKLYELKYGVAARQLHEKAQSVGDPALLSHVATRYFHTEAGYRAADQLATYFLDQGDFVVAANWFRSLQDVNADMTRLPSWQLKKALANREDVDPTTTTRVGGQLVNAKEWIEASLALGLGSSEPELLTDWPQMNGNSARRAVASGGDPLLLKRWTQPSTSSPVLLPELAQLIQSIEDQHKVAIPSTMPIAVNGRLIYRSLRGITVVDADTGTRLWESNPGISAESIFLQRRGGRVGGLIGGIGTTTRNGQRISNYDQSEIASVLFRDGVWGLVSSDGHRVFVLEDHAIAGANRSSYAFSSRRPTDRYNRDWNSNRLAAYDLNMGRIAWQVGGSELGESFDLPLAGTSFLGVPLVDGDEALVIGERDAEVHLHALDAETGKPKWSALLGYAESPIDRDTVRRNWSAQVAVDGGVIVCPTTLGWMIAIDRTSHSILWASRFSKIQPQPTTRRFGRNLNTNQLKPLNERWGPSTPIIVNDKVLVTPPEDPILCCLDLATGEKLWQIKKGPHLYVAAIHNKTVVLVGNRVITAVSLENGTEIWAHKMDFPAIGIGVPVENRYYLPIQDGHIASISLDTGEVLERFRADTKSARLGNLLMYGGQVFAQSTLGVTAFEQKDAFVKEVAERQRKTPNDPWTNLQSARIQLTEGNAAGAAKILAEIDPQSLRPNDQQELQLIRKQALTTVVRKDRENAGAALEQLAKLADSPATELQVVQMKFENERQWGSRSAAIDHLFELVNQDTSQYVDLHSQHGKIRLSTWLAGRFRDMNQLMSVEERESVDSRIAEMARAALDGTTEEQQQFLAIFAGHSAAIPVAEHLADHLIEDRKLVEAESILRRLMRDDSTGLSTAPIPNRHKIAAEYKLASLLESHDQLSDALSIYRHLSATIDQTAAEVAPTEPAETIDSRSIKDLATEAVERLTQSSTALAADASWGDQWQMDRMGSSYSSRSGARDLMKLPTDAGFFNQFRVQHDKIAGRINFVKQDDEIHWSVPFHRYQASQQVTVEVVGHRIYVLHAEVLQCLSPIEKRVIWTRRFSDAIPSYVSTSYGPTTFGISRQGAYLVGQSQSGRTGGSMLAIVNSNYVAVRGRGSVEIVDAATGETRFELSRQGMSTQVFGTYDAIILREPEAEPIVLSSADGTKIDTTLSDQLFDKLVTQTESGLITLDGRKVLFGFMEPATTVSKIDPTRKPGEQTVWTTTVSGKNWYSRIDPHTLAAVSSTGQLRLVDLTSGQMTDLGSPLPIRKPLRSAIVLADADRLYVLATDNSSWSHSGGNLPSAFVNGELVAVNRADGKRLWSQKTENANLILEYMRHTPLLLLTSRKTVTQNGQTKVLPAVIAIDKRTGAVAAKTRSSTSNSYQSVRLSKAARFVELRSYSHRLRVSANKSTTATAKPDAADAE